MADNYKNLAAIANYTTSAQCICVVEGFLLGAVLLRISL